MAESTTFGVEVKKQLLGPPKRTQKWLAEEISKRTGLTVDDPYLSKILAGQRSSPKVVKAIQEILGISDISINKL